MRQFHLCYNDLCKMQSMMPLAVVMAHQKKNMLCLNGDRLTYDEWVPVLHALSLDNSLHFISVHSTRSAKIAMEDMATESRVRTLRRVPLLQTRYILLLLMKAIRTCMCHTEVLASVELEGLPLAPHYLSELVKGVQSCRSLQHISLCRSPIGDEGCQLICRATKLHTNIQSLDLSSCGITAEGVLAVVEMLKHQKIQRYSEIWRQTLRDQEPNLDSLPGVHRVTLNHNINIGDVGAVHLMDVLRDDVFLKALDLQNCGVGNTGGKAALEMLHSNMSLEIVDLRGNQNISSELLTQIMRQLHINNKGVPPKYHWFRLVHKPLGPKLHICPKSQPSVKKTSSSCCMELEKAKQQIQWMSQQLSSEAVKCRQMEEKNMALQHYLEDLLGHNYVLVEKQTMTAIQESFSDFQKFIQKLHNMGLSELLDADVLDSLENLETDDKQHLSFLIRKLCRNPAVHNKSNPTDLQEVLRASSM